MKATKFFAWVVVLVLLASLSGAAGAQEPQQASNGGCVVGGVYDPVCDVNRDDIINIVDIMLVASKWREEGAWIGDGGYWTQTGSDIYYNSGDVGIGTTSPEAKLDVRGNVKLQSGKEVGSMTLGAETGTLYQIAGAGSSDSSGQVQGGFGLLSGDNQISPIIWMYAYGGKNAFQVRRKGFDDTVQNGTLLFEVTQAGNASVNGTTTTKVLEITGGSDLAEPFEIIGAENIEPGVVVAIDPKHPGQLRIADKAYDHTVAGCVSGANGLNPGLVMQQEGSVADGTFPVALSGRVYCWADASYGPIEPGDLLTTSDTAGHVMAVSDYVKAQGAIIGKAMMALEEGRGLILVLVSLQ